MALDFDVILEELEDFGRYQKFVVFLLSVPACFMNVFGFSYLFAGYTPDFYCVPSDSDQKIDSYDIDWKEENLFLACAYKRNDGGNNISWYQCSNFTFNKTYFSSTVATDWNLVCDRAILPKIMMSVHSVVTLFGCLANSYVQDLWGRKPAFLIVLTAYMLGSITSVFSPNFLTYAVLRSLVAFSTTSIWNVTYTWSLEYVGPRKRSMVTMIVCTLYGVGAAFVGGIAWLCETWIKLTLVGSLPFLVLYSYAFIVDESPRWLLSRGRSEDALKTVRKMARWDNRVLKEETVQKLLFPEELDRRNSQNCTSVPPEESELLVGQNGLEKKMDISPADDHHDRTECVPVTKKTRPIYNDQKPPRIQDLFRTRNIRLKTFLITYCWAANLLTYIAIAYNMENLKGNLFITYTLQAAVEIPASLLIVPLLEHYGRIPPLSVSMVACSLLLFLAVPIDSLYPSTWTIVSLALAAKFGITLSFGILVQLAGESYPTQLRGLGTGISSFVGGLGSAIMPYVVHSAKFYKMLPMVLMGATAFTSGISVLLLPETKGCYMPETIEEAETKQTVGYVTMKENLKRMRCGGEKAYNAVGVVKNNAEVETSN